MYTPIIKTPLRYLIWVALPLLFVACDADDDGNAPLPAPVPAALRVTFTHTWNGTPLNAGTRYTLDNGDEVALSGAAILLDEFALAGISTELNQYGFIVKAFDAPNAVYTLADTAGPGTGSQLSFFVGPDSITNHQDPLALAQDDPLNDPSMHWGWNPAAGYKFLVAEGNVFSNAGADTTYFGYQFATDAARTAVTLNEDIAVLLNGNSDNEVVITVAVDWAKFFAGVDVKTDNDIHGFGNSASTKIQGNFSSAFSIGSVN